MRKLPYVLLIAILLIYGCSSTPDAKRLAMVDSLVKAELYDSAYHEITGMDTYIDNEGDRAHYQLLLTQTSYLTDNTLSTDEVIDSAISYFEKGNDMEKLTDAYYYKAACWHERGDFPLAIQYYKKAEETAQKTHDLRLQYKIAESIARINQQSGNYSLQADYARKALGIAMASRNKNWIAYAYFNLGKAFQIMHDYDSLTVYVKELIPRLDDIYPEDLPHFLSLIGYMYYRNGELDQAKKYYKEALSHQELAITLGNLADVYVKEGNEEEAYKLWQKAFLLNDGSRKDIIMYNMLEYDLNHHQELENASKRLYDIFAFRDSMTNALKDRTVLELQREYDTERQNHIHEKKRMTWTIFTLSLTLILLLLAGLLKYKYNKTRMLLSKHQMLVNQYSNEIRQLEAQCRIMDEVKSKNNELEESYGDAKRKIAVLTQKIEDVVKKASPMLNRGKLLYDDILSNKKSTVLWNKYDYKCFVEYYKALNLRDFEVLEKQYGHLTHHNAFFLILWHKGLDNKEISQIMGIKEDSIRSIRFRMQKKKKQ